MDQNKVNFDHNTSMKPNVGKLAKPSSFTWTLTKTMMTMHLMDQMRSLDRENSIMKTVPVMPSLMRSKQLINGSEPTHNEPVNDNNTLKGNHDDDAAADANEEEATQEQTEDAGKSKYDSPALHPRALQTHNKFGMDEGYEPSWVTKQYSVKKDIKSLEKEWGSIKEATATPQKRND
eukprot:jgi/Psemu1/50016/gm1.50016_g